MDFGAKFWNFPFHFRAIDLVTPLCSQVVYEGLLDDSFDVKSGVIEFGAEVTGKEQIEKVILSSQDEVCKF